MSIEQITVMIIAILNALSLTVISLTFLLFAISYLIKQKRKEHSNKRSHH